jgi:hypothetical protein
MYGPLVAFTADRAFVVAHGFDVTDAVGSTVEPRRSGPVRRPPLQTPNVAAR